MASGCHGMGSMTQIASSDNEIRRPLRLGEDSRRKSKQFVVPGDRLFGPDSDNLAAKWAHFANANGDLMLRGVSDAGQGPGMTQEQLDAVEQSVNNNCSVRPSPQSKLIPCDWSWTATLLLQWTRPQRTLCTTVLEKVFPAWAAPRGE